MMLFGALLALVMNTATFAAPEPAGTPSALKNAVILIIRHAEKPESGNTLSPAGEAHAQAYANYFKSYSIDGQPHRPDRLFAARDSSTSDRPRLTLEPTAQALGLPIDSRFDDNQFRELAQQVQSSSQGANILICWHHGNIPNLLQALGADPGKLLPKAKWPEEVFNWVMQLRYDENGQLLDSTRITENLTPADAAQPKPEPDTKSVAKPEPDTKSVAKPAPDTKSVAKPEPEPKSAAKPEPDTKSVAKPEPDTKSDAKKTGHTPVTGGVDPHGDSWASIQNSLRQFGQLQFILRLFLSLVLTVACAWVIGWHPRRSTLGDPLSDLEERKALIVLSVVGAVVAELSGTNQALAFVIFGIGALARFRTALDNPKLTGKAIVVVVIGLACGMGSWAMAVFVTAFTWALVYWLESRVGCRLKIRLDSGVDPQPVYGAVQSFLISRHCRLQSSELNEGKRQMTFLMLIPSALDPRQLESDVRTQLPKADNARIEIQAA
jgi:hypothetical protein